MIKLITDIYIYNLKESLYLKYTIKEFISFAFKHIK